MCIRDRACIAALVELAKLCCTWAHQIEAPYLTERERHGRTLPENRVAPVRLDRRYVCKNQPHKASIERRPCTSLAGFTQDRPRGLAGQAARAPDLTYRTLTRRRGACASAEPERMRGLGGRGVCDSDGSRRPRSDPPAIPNRDPGRHETPRSRRCIETLRRMGKGLDRLLPKNARVRAKQPRVIPSRCDQDPYRGRFQ